jgi:hypothetical protein
MYNVLEHEFSAKPHFFAGARISSHLTRIQTLVEQSQVLGLRRRTAGDFIARISAHYHET